MNEYLDNLTDDLLAIRTNKTEQDTEEPVDINEQIIEPENSFTSIVSNQQYVDFFSDGIPRKYSTNIQDLGRTIDALAKMDDEKITSMNNYIPVSEDEVIRIDGDTLTYAPKDGSPSLTFRNSNLSAVESSAGYIADIKKSFIDAKTTSERMAIKKELTDAISKDEALSKTTKDALIGLRNDWEIIGIVPTKDVEGNLVTGKYGRTLASDYVVKNKKTGYLSSWNSVVSEDYGIAVTPYADGTNLTESERYRDIAQQEHYRAKSYYDRKSGILQQNIDRIDNLKTKFQSIQLEQLNNGEIDSAELKQRLKIFDDTYTPILGNKSTRLKKAKEYVSNLENPEEVIDSIIKATKTGLQIKLSDAKYNELYNYYDNKFKKVKRGDNKSLKEMSEANAILDFVYDGKKKEQRLLNTDRAVSALRISLDDLSKKEIETLSDKAPSAFFHQDINLIAANKNLPQKPSKFGFNPPKDGGVKDYIDTLNQWVGNVLTNQTEALTELGGKIATAIIPANRSGATNLEKDPVKTYFTDISKYVTTVNNEGNNRNVTVKEVIRGLGMDAGELYDRLEKTIKKSDRTRTIFTSFTEKIKDTFAGNWFDNLGDMEKMIHTSGLSKDDKNSMLKDIEAFKMARDFENNSFKNAADLQDVLVSQNMDRAVKGVDKLVDAAKLEASNLSEYMYPLFNNGKEQPKSIWSSELSEIATQDRSKMAPNENIGKLNSAHNLVGNYTPISKVSPELKDGEEFINYKGTAVPKRLAAEYIDKSYDEDGKEIYSLEEIQKRKDFEKKYNTVVEGNEGFLSTLTRNAESILTTIIRPEFPIGGKWLNDDFEERVLRSDIAGGSPLSTLADFGGGALTGLASLRIAKNIVGQGTINRQVDQIIKVRTASQNKIESLSKDALDALNKGDTTLTNSIKSQIEKEAYTVAVTDASLYSAKEAINKKVKYVGVVGVGINYAINMVSGSYSEGEHRYGSVTDRVSNMNPSALILDGLMDSSITAGIHVLSSKSEKLGGGIAPLSVEQRKSLASDENTDANAQAVKKVNDKYASKENSNASDETRVPEISNIIVAESAYESMILKEDYYKRQGAEDYWVVDILGAKTALIESKKEFKDKFGIDYVGNNNFNDFITANNTLEQMYAIDNFEYINSNADDIDITLGENGDKKIKYLEYLNDPELPDEKIEIILEVKDGDYTISRNGNIEHLGNRKEVEKIANGAKKEAKEKPKVEEEKIDAEDIIGEDLNLNNINYEIPTKEKLEDEIKADVEDSFAEGTKNEVDIIIFNENPKDERINDAFTNKLDDIETEVDDALSKAKENGSIKEFINLKGTRRIILNAETIEEANTRLDELFPKQFNSRNEFDGRTFTGVKAGKSKDSYIGLGSSLQTIERDPNTGEYYVDLMSNIKNGDKTYSDISLAHYLSSALKNHDMFHKIIMADKVVYDWAKKKGYIKNDYGYKRVRYATTNGNSMYRSGDVVVGDRDNGIPELNAYNIVREAYDEYIGNKNNEIDYNIRKKDAGQLANSLIRTVIKLEDTRIDNKFDGFKKPEPHEVIDIIEVKKRKSNIHKVNRDVEDFFKDPNENRKEATKDIVDWINSHIGSNTVVLHKDKISMFSRNENSQLFDSYGFSDRPMSGFDILIMLGHSDDFVGALRFYNEVIKNNTYVDPEVRKTNKDSKPIESTSTTQTIDKAFPNKPKTEEVKNGWLSDLLTARGLNETVKGVNLKDLVSSFFNEVNNEYRLEMRTNKDNTAGIVVRDFLDKAVRIRSSNRYYHGTEKFNIDNFSDGEPSTVIFAENMFDAIAYIGVRLQDGDLVKEDLEKLRIVDMGSINSPIKKEEALRFIGKKEDVDVHYAEDALSGNEKTLDSNKAYLEEIKKNINDATEEATGVGAIIHQAEDNDFNTVFKKDDINRILGNINARANDKDIEYKPAVRVAFEELNYLMFGVFRKDRQDGNNRLNAAEGDSHFNIKTARIHLANDTTWKTVFHEVIHSIQESNVFFKDPKAEYTASQQDMVDLVKELSAKDKQMKFFGADDGIFSKRYQEEVVTATLNGDKNPYNTAIKEVLNNMLIDKELGEWMNTHKIVKDKNGSITGFEKVEPNLDGTSNADSIFSKIMNAIKDVINVLANANKDSIYGTMIQAIEDGINTNNGKTYLNTETSLRFSSKESTQTLYSRDKKTIDRYLSKPIILEAISLAIERTGSLSAERIGAIVDEIGQTRYGQKFSDLYGSGWDKISETYFGEIASKGKKIFDTVVSGSQEESDALIDHRNIMEKMRQTSVEVADKWKRLNKDSYANMHHSNKEKLALSTLIRYDIKSMRVETIERVIDAISEGDVNELKTIHNESKQAINNLKEYLIKKDSEEEGTNFINSIANLQNLVFRNSMTTNTPHNASVIFERHFKDYNFKDSQRKIVISAIDEFISTKAIYQAVENKADLREIFKEMKDKNSVNDYKDFFVSFANASRNISDVGRKGELKRSDLINSRVFAMKKDLYDALPIEEKKQFNKYKVINQGTDELGKPLDDGYIHFVQPDYTLPSQEVDIRGVMRDSNNDADIEVSEDALVQMNKQFKLGGASKLETYIVDKYYSETDKENYYKEGLRNTGNIYPVIRKNRVVGLKKMLPREAVEDNSVNFLDIIGNYISEAKYKSDSSKQHNIFMEKYGFNRKRFSGIKQEESFVENIKKYLNPDEKETKDIPIDLVFLSESHFLHKKREFSELAITKSFKDKYKKIGKGDSLPDDMSGVQYVRRDFYDQVVKQKELFVDSEDLRQGIKTFMDAISTSKMAITIANPKTLINNIVFNSTIVATHAGISALESFNNIRKHYSSYKDYFSLKEELSIMSIKRGVTKEQITKLENKVKNHEMYYYDEKMNLFNIKVDTVNIDASSQQNRFYRFVGETAQSLNKNFEYGGKTPLTKNISKAAGFAFFADGSKSKNFGSAMARLGDELPKIEIFNIIKDEELAKGKSEKEAEKFARNYAMDQFVDSRKNVNATLSLSDRTVFPFAKWTWQKLKSSAAMAKRKKFNTALVSILVYNMIDDDDGRDLFMYGSVDSGYGFMMDVILNSDEKVASLDLQVANIANAGDSLINAGDRLID